MPPASARSDALALGLSLGAAATSAYVLWKTTQEPKQVPTDNNKKLEKKLKQQARSRKIESLIMERGQAGARAAPKSHAIDAHRLHAIDATRRRHEVRLCGDPPTLPGGDEGPDLRRALDWEAGTVPAGEFVVNAVGSVHQSFAEGDGALIVVLWSGCHANVRPEKCPSSNLLRPGAGWAD